MTARIALVFSLLALPFSAQCTLLNLTGTGNGVAVGEGGELTNDFSQSHAVDVFFSLDTSLATASTTYTLVSNSGVPVEMFEWTFEGPAFTGTYSINGETIHPDSGPIQVVAANAVPVSVLNDELGRPGFTWTSPMDVLWVFAGDSGRNDEQSDYLFGLFLIGENSWFEAGSLPTSLDGADLGAFNSISGNQPYFLFGEVEAGDNTVLSRFTSYNAQEVPPPGPAPVTVPVMPLSMSALLALALVSIAGRTAPPSRWTAARIRTGLR